MSRHWSSYFLSLLRIVAAASFMTHGTQKLFGMPPMGGGMTIPLMSQFGVAGILETFGGLLLLVGLFSRPVAFILAGEMAFAFFQAHFPRAFLPIVNGGEPAVLYCFIWLYVFAAGPGPLSLDALFGRGKRR
ncbi:MAG TPA: DoxX family protein [Vicinamibacterales bacterium]|jgi:putative oxidoreductase|nr:DoxX family protein [Vicinamibacterales bacterium]